MRPLLCLGLVFLSCIVLGQEDETFFNSVPTDVIISVRRHNTGADLVEITMRDPSYPVDLLKQQISTMCESYDAPARGVFAGSVPLGDTKDPKLQAVKASFATNGLMDPESGVLKIQPMLRAFAGVPAPHTITGFMIDFEDVAPVAGTTVLRYSVENVVRGEGRFTGVPPLRGLEYRIKLFTQDPAQITFPDHIETGKPSSAPPLPAKDNRTLIIVLFCVAGIAAGALVYFAMLRTGFKTRL